MHRQLPCACTLLLGCAGVFLVCRSCPTSCGHLPSWVCAPMLAGCNPGCQPCRHAWPGGSQYLLFVSTRMYGRWLCVIVISNA
jgi:hypothetical protein